MSDETMSECPDCGADLAVETHKAGCPRANPALAAYLQEKLDAPARGCGTCDYWQFGQRSYCMWEFFPGAQALSSAYKAGGECHAMAGGDGKDCPTWAKRSEG